MFWVLIVPDYRATGAGAGPKNRGSFSAIVPLNNPWELRAFGVTHQTSAPPPLLPPVRVRVLATRRRGSLYIGSAWIRQPKELNMKRLLACVNQWLVAKTVG